MNQRPPGYEPGELPDCSTPHYSGTRNVRKDILAPWPIDCKERCELRPSHTPHLHNRAIRRRSASKTETRTTLGASACRTGMRPIARNALVTPAAHASSPQPSLRKLLQREFPVLVHGIAIRSVLRNTDASRVHIPDPVPYLKTPSAHKLYYCE